MPLGITAEVQQWRRFLRPSVFGVSTKGQAEPSFSKLRGKFTRLLTNYCLLTSNSIYFSLFSLFVIVETMGKISPWFLRKLDLTL